MHHYLTWTKLTSIYKQWLSSSLKQVLEILHSACVIQIGQAEAALSDKQQAGF